MHRSALITFLLYLLATCSVAIEARPQRASWHKRAIHNVISDGASLDGRSFDYVIVGGGTSALAAAYELSKDASKNVLVIEAGGDPRNEPKVASYATYTEAFGDRLLDWNRLTVPQQAANGKVVSLHAGKGIGGSSGINGGIFSVPPSTQIDSIGALGNSGWSWDTFIPALKGFQRFHAPTPSQVGQGLVFDASSHSTYGPVDLCYPSPHDAHDDAFRSSIRDQLGVPHGGDLGSGKVKGAAYLAKFWHPSDEMRRVSAATAFVNSIEETRSNLVILTNTRATKILWQRGASPAQASGVQFQGARSSPLHSVLAKQVIVAAGAIHSPQFLEVSGVGSPKVLSAIGVETVVSLPGVGANLIEQAKAQVHGGPPRAGTLHSSRVNNIGAFLTLDQLFSNASAMASYVDSHLEGWAQSVVESGGSVSRDGLLQQYNQLHRGIFRANESWPVAEYLYVAYDGDSYLDVWSLPTFSRGYSHATSSSVWTRPRIDPQYFSVPIDMELQVAAMRGARKTLQGGAFANVSEGGETRPGFDPNNGGIPQGAAGGRYSWWQQYILDTYESVWHLMGTCAMMPQEVGGVVGPDFKVHQTGNVWVIDASVIPIPLASHTASLVYSLAIKAAGIVGLSSTEP